MIEIDLPKFDALPSDADPTQHTAEVLAFLITSLLAHDDAVLHAEHRRPEPEVTWYIRPRSEGGEGEDTVVAILPAGMFSSQVSRVALMFKIDYINGGHGTAILTQESSRHECRVFLSRCRESGYWIRMYAKSVNMFEEVQENGLSRFV